MAGSHVLYQSVLAVRHWFLDRALPGSAPPDDGSTLQMILEPTTCTRMPLLATPLPPMRARRRKCPTCRKPTVLPRVDLLKRTMSGVCLDCEGGRPGYRSRVREGMYGCEVCGWFWKDMPLGIRWGWVSRTRMQACAFCMANAVSYDRMIHREREIVTRELVKLYERGERRAIWTMATSVEQFVPAAASRIVDALEAVESSDRRVEMLTDWMDQAIEVACALKGYKTDRVLKEQVLHTGNLPPEDEAEVMGRRNQAAEPGAEGES